MRIGGIGIATVNARGWDGSAWQNLRVVGTITYGLRSAIYDDARGPAQVNIDDDGAARSINSLRTIALTHGFNGSSWDRLRSDPNYHLDVNIGGLANLAHAQVAMSSTRATIKAANTSRKAMCIKNIGTGDVCIGSTAVTTANGFKLAPGESLSDIRTTAEVDGICAAGVTTTVCYWEE